MKRRDFLRAAATSAVAMQIDAETAQPSVDGGTGDNTVKSFPLEERTISQLQHDMEQGRYTARRLVEMYLERIEQVDRGGPELNAVIELNPEAAAIAERLDGERGAGHVRGPLHGIPVLIKDNIGTADKMMTTAGSLALVGARPKRDAFIVRQLRRAGAILLGKTNLSEWANYRSTHSTSGWSGRGGQTRNPYALDRNPCGSSSGSGAGVSANLCAVAIGTETNGSIVCPSSTNGVVGIKPTVGLVGRSGIVPLAHSQDVAGPMARTVTDAAILLTCIAGVDPRDTVTQNDQNVACNYAADLSPDALRGKRIGVARNYFGFHARVDQVVEQALDTMQQRGAVLVDPANVNRSGYGRSGGRVLSYEFKADINKYLAALGSDAAVHNLDELIQFNERHRDREMPFFGQELFLMAQKKGDLSTPEYQEALQRMHRVARDEGIDATLKEHALDAIVAPTAGPAWVTDLILGDHGSGGSSTPAARAGYPNVTVPAGDVFGLPVGISFFSRAYSERLLIQLAYAFEQASRCRKPPRFRPHAQLDV